MSEALRELVQSLGFSGDRGNATANYGTLSGSESVFDSLTSFGTGAQSSVLFFTGANAESVYGGPVPLTSAGANAPQNFYATGNPAGQAGSDLTADLMYGGGGSPGQVRSFSMLDQAMLSDLGWTVDPTIGFLSDASVGETAGSLTSIVVRTGDLSQPATVHYATVDGSAKAGVNYVSESGTITFAAGQARATVSVPILADHVVTGSLGFSIALSAPIGGVLGSAATQSVQVVDQTTSIGLVATPGMTVSEDAGSITIAVDRTAGDTSSTVSVHYATSAGTAVPGVNYTTTSGTLTFGPGQTEETITVPVMQDHFSNGDHDFRLTLDSPSGPGDAVLGVSSTDVVVLDTTNKISLGSTSYQAGEDDGTVAILVDNTGRGGSSPVSVHYTTAGGSAVGGVNYQPVSGTLSFFPGQAQATIFVPVIQDGAITGNLDFHLFLSLPGGNAVLGQQTLADVTIVDTTNLISIQGPTVPVGEDDGVALVQVTRTGPDGPSPATLTYSTSDGTAKAGVNYTPTSGSLTFEPGQTQATIAIPIIQDGLDVDDLGFSLNIISLGTADFLSGPATTQVDIANTTGTVGFLDVNATVDEDANSISFRVVKDGTNPSTVVFSTADGTAKAGVNYAASSGVLNFAAGHDIETLTIPILDDSVAGPDLAFQVVLGATTGNVAVTASASSRTITVVNVDSAGLSFTHASGTPLVVEQGAGYAANFALQSRPVSAVTITPSSLDGRLSFSPTSITFTPASWNIPQAFDILASFDGKRATGTPSAVNFAVSSTDPSYGASRDQALSIGVDNPPNLGPILSQPANVTMNGASVRTITLSATDPYQGAILSYSLAAGAPSWVTLKGDQLTLSPPNGNASATVSINVADDGTPTATAKASFAVQVDDVPPNVQAGPDADVVAGGTFTRAITATSPGSASLSATVDYGDGSGFVPLALDATGSGTLGHVYASAGAFPVVVVVTDASGSSSTSRFTIVATAAPISPSISFTSSAFSTTEGASVATITVSRGGDLSGTATVNYATTANAATPGVDFQETSGVLTFGPGIATASFPVSILHDSTSFTERTVNLVLSSVSGASLGSIARSTLTIANIDTAPGGSPASGGSTGGGPVSVPLVGPPSIQTVVKKGKIKQIVLTFASPLNAASVNAANHLVLSNPTKGKKAGKAIKIRVAYTGGGDVVTLTPRAGLRASGRASLRITGVIDSLGRSIDGNRDGIAGGDYVTTVALKTGRAPS